MSERRRLRAALYAERKRLARQTRIRLNELYKIRYSPSNWVPLPRPQRAGWERTYVLRHDTPPAETQRLRAVLKLVNSTVTSPRRDFLHRSWRTKKLIPIEQPLRDLEEYEYLALDDTFKREFMRVMRRERRYGSSQPHWVARWAFKRPWLFVQRVRVHYVTHTLVTDTSVESEIRRLNDMYNSPDGLWRYEFEGHAHSDDSYDMRVRHRDLRREPLP